MRPPGVLPILEGFGGTRGFEQSVAQPRCIASVFGAFLQSAQTKNLV